MSRKPDLRTVAFALALQCCSGASWSATATLKSDVTEAAAGYFRLSWTAEQPVRLVESRSASFDTSRTVYAGADTARVMSGKPDGDWFYRLEAISSGAVVAGPTAVTVRHHSLRRAFAFFSLGAAVFGATLGLIFFGGRVGHR
jgi:hypothetical protein